MKLVRVEQRARVGNVKRPPYNQLNALRKAIQVTEYFPVNYNPNYSHTRRFQYINKNSVAQALKRKTNQRNIVKYRKEKIQNFYENIRRMNIKYYENLPNSTSWSKHIPYTIVEKPRIWGRRSWILPGTDRFIQYKLGKREYSLLLNNNNNNNKLANKIKNSIINSLKSIINNKNSTQMNHYKNFKIQNKSIYKLKEQLKNAENKLEELNTESNKLKKEFSRLENKPLPAPS